MLSSFSYRYVQMNTEAEIQVNFKNGQESNSILPGRVSQQENTGVGGPLRQFFLYSFDFRM